MREGPEDAGEVEVVDKVPTEAGNDCEGKIRLEDRGNRDYAWWYLINTADRDATLTIRRTWTYEDEIRSDTKQHILYPGEAREVFSFPRNQKPRVTFVHCRLG